MQKWHIHNHSSLESVGLFFYVLNKLILLFNKNVLNWSKVTFENYTVNVFLINVLFINESWNKCVTVSTRICSTTLIISKINVFWKQNVKVSSSYVNHRLYFTHKLKNPIIKPHRKISKEPTANYSSGFWRHSSPTLYKNNSKIIVLIVWCKYIIVKAT